MIVICGRYEQEVDAESFIDAVAKAFAIRLPNSIGEILGVKKANPAKRKGWDAAAYMWTPNALSRIGAMSLYLPDGPRWRLNTESPEIEKVEETPKEGN